MLQGTRSGGSASFPLPPGSRRWLPPSGRTEPVRSYEETRGAIDQERRESRWKRSRITQASGRTVQRIGQEAPVEVVPVVIVEGNRNVGRPRWPERL